MREYTIRVVNLAFEMVMIPPEAPQVASTVLNTGPKDLDLRH